MSISERFIQIRKVLDLTQKQFADGLEVSKTVVNLIESGQSEPSRQIMVKLAAAYNDNINWLLIEKGSHFISDDGELSLKDAVPLILELSKLDNSKIDTLRKMNKLSDDKKSRIIKIIDEG